MHSGHFKLLQCCSSFLTCLIKIQGSNAELNISISGDFADIFEVEPATARGEVIPTIRVQNSSALDYEAVKSYTIFVSYLKW